jgi:hypothetical protein
MFQCDAVTWLCASLEWVQTRTWWSKHGPGWGNKWSWFWILFLCQLCAWEKAFMCLSSSYWFMKLQCQRQRTCFLSIFRLCYDCCIHTCPSLLTDAAHSLWHNNIRSIPEGAQTLLPAGANSGWLCWESSRGMALILSHLRCGCCLTASGQGLDTLTLEGSGATVEWSAICWCWMFGQWIWSHKYYLIIYFSNVIVHFKCK